MEDTTREQASDFRELLALQKQVKSRIEVSYDLSGIEDTLKKWLDKIREIAQKYGPASYTITTGIPLGVNASFSWPTQPGGNTKQR